MTFSSKLKSILIIWIKTSLIMEIIKALVIMWPIMSMRSVRAIPMMFSKTLMFTMMSMILVIWHIRIIILIISATIVRILIIIISKIVSIISLHIILTNWSEIISSPKATNSSYLKYLPFKNIFPFIYHISTFHLHIHIHQLNNSTNDHWCKITN